MTTLSRYGLYFAWLVALGATAGSLYFSEVLLFVPCSLCWWQRIIMYPQVLLLGLGAYMDDRTVVRYSLPLAVIGMGVSAYHYLGQKFPQFMPLGACRGGVPCDMQYINWLGFMTIPFLAFVAFTLLTVFLVAVLAGGTGSARQRSAA